jgi:hypothetical protein
MPSDPERHLSGDSAVAGGTHPVDQHAEFGWYVDAAEYQNKADGWAFGLIPFAVPVPAKE